MSKRVRTTRVTTKETEVIDAKNPIALAIREFFESGSLDPSLQGLSYKIRVQKYSTRSGRMETLIGTQYSELEGMLESLADRYGDARYKFYVNAFDETGKQVATAIIPDLPLLRDVDDGSGPTDVETFAGPTEMKPAQATVTEVLLAQMKMQNELLIALVTKSAGGSGGGVSVNDMTTLIRLGQEMATGAAGGDNDVIGDILKSPLGAELAKRVLGDGGPGPAEHIMPGAVEVPAAGDNGAGARVKVD